MKKTTGKVVSLVLALALVVTSFSATFAFAATKSETVTVTPANTTIVLSNGGTGLSAKVDLSTLAAVTSANVSAYDHFAVPTMNISQIAHVSGDSLLTFDAVNGVVTGKATLKGANVSGTEVIAILYKVDSQRIGDTDTTTFTGSAQITIKVLAAGTVVVGDAAATPIAVQPANGVLPLTDTIAKNDIAPKTLALYTVAANTTVGSETAVATYTPDATVSSTKGNGVYTPASSNATSLAVTAAAGAVTITPTKVSPEPYVRIGNYAITFTKYKTAGAGFAVDTAAKTVTAVIKVGNSVKLSSTLNNIFAWRGITWAAASYVLPDGAPVTDSVTGLIVPVDRAVNVTGADITLDTTATTVTTIYSGVVGKVDGASILHMDGGAATSVGDSVPTFVMTNGTVSSVAAKDVTVSGGKTGDITAATSISVDAAVETVPTVVGKLSAPVIIVDSTAGKTLTGAIKSGVTGITLKGSKTSVGAIDMNYYTSLTFDGFVGTIASPANTKKATLTTSGTTDAVVSGASKFNMLSLNAGKVSFTTSLVADSVSGAGELDVYAGKLNVASSLTGISLRLLDKTFAKGTVVLTSDAYKVYEGMFTTIGFTLEKVSGTTTDAFKIATVDFAGLVLDKTSDKILVGKKATYTVSAYPSSTQLPAGYTIKWDFTGGDDYFNFTTTATTATVEAKKYETTFTSLNKGQVTATVLDEYGFPVYGKQVATCDVEVVNKLDVVSDTTNDFSVESGKTYQFKLTATTAPVVTYGTAGVFSGVLASHTGNDYFYKITATGKVGSATGIYINGNKLLVATVKAPAFTSDTKGNVTVKGAYTVKITSATVPTFGVGTAGVFSAKFVSKTGNDYLYKISSVGKVGTQAGIYINGVKTFVGIVG